MTTLRDFTLPRLSGESQSLADYEGQLVLVVNTASKCGLTPQYEGLETLYKQYGDEGFVILGFPCNQFAGQEPGGADEIAEFCQINYGVTFPLFGKLDVNGPGESPLYTWLKAKFPGDVEWNFGKFLIARDGNVVQRFAPDTVPEALVPAIQKHL
ncbi:glutathione peroxidase [Devosia sp. SL43]|uniref:glutathione peroxidase n=1 Tax=Devosia sp. SL43 TaxID=2806348 RepID=UPI001F23F28E|nr:glutathione peroxidase [Devosia sp. SL43]UJW84651.1 glutathione peroxidase [Devosia sp. SL43]